MNCKNILTKDLLEQKYLIENLSIRKIAKEMKCGYGTILRYLKKYDIPRRTQSEAMKGKPSPMKGKHQSEETKKKISESNKGKHTGENNPSHRPEVRRKISESHKGERNPNYGKRSFHWKGGTTMSGGYRLRYHPNHPYAKGAGYVYEHRLVVEKYIGRYLTPKEQVHHINGIKDNNRPENLMAFTSNSAHRRYHINQNLVKPQEIVFDGRKDIKK